MIFERSSGIILHITSLPGPQGIGTLGNEAYRFADKLRDAGMRYWQILPLGPVDPGMGYSPYASSSTFAGNYLFISPGELEKEPWFSGQTGEDEFPEEHFVDFKKVIQHRKKLLHAAFGDFLAQNGQNDSDYRDFNSREHYWLDDYARYTAYSEHFGTGNWLEWDREIALRSGEAMRELDALLMQQISYHRFIQYLFFKQWAAFKAYCNSIGIQIIGDIPIYITLEGADAWANHDILQLDRASGKPLSVSGVPPDYFSSTGQRWGNPLYQWFDADKQLNSSTLAWWIRRVRHLTSLVDILRIDHFRGFESYWSIPADEETAVNGSWITGPGIGLFKKIHDELGELPLIAEDLGVITPEVEELRDELGLPGMRILQFAFDFNNKNYYLPHNIDTANCILYTGTHDNNTTNGWFYGNEINDDTRKYIMEYLGINNSSDFHWALIRQAYRTIAACVIVPMQDVLGYGADFKMNTPGTSEGNWGWKLTSEAFSDDLARQLKRMGHIYRRLPEEETT